VQLDETRFHRAIREEDRRFDGRFFTGVLTTGVYCRVVCPAPQPAKRENIRFYASAPAAEAAGFRPCARCHPERAAPPPVWSGVPPIVSRALLLIAEGALDDGGVEELAARVGLGERQLRRIFVEYLGASPVAIAKARRTHFARALIDETDLPITEIALEAGFRSVRQFNHDLRRTFGRAPTELRRGAKRRPTSSARVEIALAYRPPLDWPRAIEFLQARATPGVEVAEHDRYRRTVEVGGSPAAIEIRLARSEPKLILGVWAKPRAGLLGIAERARRLFDLQADPAAIADSLEATALLRPLVRRRPGMRVPGAWDPFELAVRAILGQQISVRAATTLAGRLVQSFGAPAQGIDLPGLTHLFPRPEVLAVADLTAIGATTAQSRAVQALSRAIVQGELRLEAGPALDDFVDQITALPGVGPWTAHYVAMRALGEPDAFPAGDLGLRRAAATGERMPTPRELERLAEKWRPWRAYAAMYLWSAAPSRQRSRERRAA
jgi:AraC family transcriptional regulator, regulatory protein of adaptative response / DNA-3-methyladenine glycosylase II